MGAVLDSWAVVYASVVEFVGVKYVSNGVPVG